TERRRDGETKGAGDEATEGDGAGTVHDLSSPWLRSIRPLRALRGFAPLRSSPASNQRAISMEGKEFFAALNASLNGLSTLLLISAYIAIRRRRYRTHGTLMVGAFLVS